MSFQALARTWRPRRFDQLVGQEHVVRALTHALDQNKLHHALLFSGTRGVGKTTLARIIAKCLNCDHGVSATPCVGDDACATCREIDEGRYVDLIEVDAASRTGVDDTRELMDNVQYAPTRGRTKVYLIDEVHMLTKHSFNALLKTLEEPPPRVQFLLATTEPEKIPVTILSRCLQFPLKRLAASRIGDRLRYVLDAESLSADDAALAALARAADGSMRDGLSLMDQAIAFSGGHLAVEGVQEMLGTIGEARVAELVDAIIDAQPDAGLAAVDALYTQGIDMRYLLDALATAWQHMATIQVVGKPVDDESERWQDAATRVDARQTQIFYDITLAGIRDLSYAPDPLVGARMCVLRLLAFRPADDDAGPPRNTQTSPNQQGKGAGSNARQAMAEARSKLKKPAAGKAAESRAQPNPQAPAAHHSNEAASQASTGAAEASAAMAGIAEEEAARGASVAFAPDQAQNTTARKDSTPAAENRRGGEIAQFREDPASELADDTRAWQSPEPEHAPFSPSERREAATAAPSVESENGFDYNAEADHPEDWHALVPRLDLQGFAAQLANHGICRHLDNRRIVLEVARTNALLATDDARERLQAALGSAWGGAQAPRLTIHLVDALDDTPAQRSEADAEQRQQAAVASIENDPIIHRLRSQLGARLRPETVKPHRSPGAMQHRDES